MGLHDKQHIAQNDDSKLSNDHVKHKHFKTGPGSLDAIAKCYKSERMV